MGWAVRSLAVGLAFWLPFCARASLGDDVLSIRADRQALDASLRPIAHAEYTVFEMQTPSGTVVRQYVSPAGRVFALVWEGPSLPDMRQLLGNFFAEYVEAPGSEGPGARVIERPGLQIYSGGRMRAFVGRAIVPRLVPSRMSLDQIK